MVVAEWWQGHYVLYKCKQDSGFSVENTFKNT